MMNIKRYSLEAQELILNRQKVMARYNGKKLTTFYYKFRIWIVQKKIENSYRKRRNDKCKKK